MIYMAESKLHKFITFDFMLKLYKHSSCKRIEHLYVALSGDPACKHQCE